MSTRVRLPEHPCRNCKRKTTRADLCRRCASPVVLDDDVALVGGRWVPSGGVMRWEVDAPEPPREPAKPFADLIACPTCRAKATDSCRTASGAPRDAHTTRLLSRRCLCGSRLAPYKRLCSTCAAESIKASKDDWAKRRSEVAA